MFVSGVVFVLLIDMLLLQHPFVEKTIFPSLNWFWIVKSQLSISVWIYSSGFCSLFVFSIDLHVYNSTVCVCLSRSVLSDSLQPPGLQPTRLLCPGNSPGKNTGVHCHLLLQGNFPTQGSNLGLLHHRHILYHPSRQERPYSSAKQSKQPKNSTTLLITSAI